MQIMVQQKFDSSGYSYSVKSSVQKLQNVLKSDGPRLRSKINSPVEVICTKLSVELFSHLHLFLRVY